jgi:hypothetical protein
VSAPAFMTFIGAERGLSRTVPLSTTNVASSRAWGPEDIAGRGALHSKAVDVGDAGGLHETFMSSTRIPST